MGRKGGKSEAEKQFDEQLGLRIADLRQMRGLRQSEFAKSCHISTQRLYAYETGRARCYPYQLALLARRLAVRVSDLIPDGA